MKKVGQERKYQKSNGLSMEERINKGMKEKGGMNRRSEGIMEKLRNYERNKRKMKKVGRQRRDQKK